MPNNRNYFPILGLAFGKLGTDFRTGTNITGFIAAHGLQSYGSTTNFNLEPVNELGQIEVYENIEGIPNVDLTAEKVVDGYPLLQHLASQTPAGVSSLNGRYNTARCTALALTYSEAQNAISGLPLAVAEFSGLYVSAINFNIPVDGNITESVTLVGNNKVWYTGTALPTGIFFASGSRFNNADSPPGTGGVQRRENVVMTTSRWPTDIPGISAGNVNTLTAGVYAAHIQNVQVGVSLNRTELNELGRRGPYYRFADFPTDVTCSIEITANEFGDQRSAFEEQLNLNDQPIKIVLECGVVIDLGTKNKLTSISTAGGDTGGGNQTITYNYTNQNSLTVTFPNNNYDFLS